MLTLRRFTVLAALAAATLVAASSASAAPTFDDFPVPTGTSGIGNTSGPHEIVLGPDGNLWFVEKNAAKLGKVVPSNPPVITDVAAPAGATNTEHITVGPDNHLWYTGGNVVVEADPANPAGATAHGGIGLQAPKGVATGPDGNLWIVDNLDNEVQRVDTAGATFGTDVALSTGCNGQHITRGPDNNMWVTCFGSEEIARIPAGSAPTAEFFALPTGVTPMDIAPGPDGRIWFTAQQSDIGAITTAGTPTVYQGKGTDVFGLARGPDGAMWFTQVASHNIGRSTTAGATSEFPSLARATDPDGAFPRYITPGPQNTLWFTEEFGNRIGRITNIDLGGGGGGGAAGGGGGGTTADVLRPGLSGTGMSDTTLVVGPGATPRNGTTTADKTGTTIRYTLSEAATVRLRFERKLAGRRRGRRCVKPRRSLRRRRKCTRYQNAGTLVRTSKRGKNSVKFSGRIGRKALKRGRYRLVLRATDTAGNKSSLRRLNFRVVKPPKARRKRR